MTFKKTKDFKIYYTFLNKLAKDLTNFYYTKLNKTFTINNKLKGKGYDPVTSADKAFEKFIRKKINDKFPDHQIIGEEFGAKKTKSLFSWIIDPIDGTRSFVAGNPTWSNLISLNYNDAPIVGLANFPRMKRYYLNQDGKSAFLVDRRCPSLIKGFESGYAYKRIQASGERYDDRPEKNMYSHIHDALQYLLIGAGEGRSLMNNQKMAMPFQARTGFDVFKRKPTAQRKSFWSRM